MTVPQSSTDQLEGSARSGSEVSLSRWSSFFSIVGILSLLAGGILGLAWVGGPNPGDRTGYLSAIVLCVVGGLSSLFSGALLRAASDVIRLLKKSNGLPYHGEL